MTAPLSSMTAPAHECIHPLRRARGSTIQRVLILNTLEIGVVVLGCGGTADHAGATVGSGEASVARDATAPEAASDRPPAHETSRDRPPARGADYEAYILAHAKAAGGRVGDTTTVAGLVVTFMSDPKAWTGKPIEIEAQFLGSSEEADGNVNIYQLVDSQASVALMRTYGLSCSTAVPVKDRDLKMFDKVHGEGEACVFE